jgi:hypothetical protein
MYDDYYYYWYCHSLFVILLSFFSFTILLFAFLAPFSLGKKEKRRGEDITYLFIYSVLVVRCLLDFGSLFLVLILYLGKMAADLLAVDRHRLYRRCRLGLS